MLSERNIDTGSRRGLKREEIVQGILASYHCTRDWRRYRGGYDLAKTGWLRRFAEEITKDAASLDPWNTLKEKCDASFMIEHLYIMTLPEKTARKKKATTNRAFKAQIEKMLPRYDKLQDDIIGLFRGDRIILLVPGGRDLLEEFLKLQQSKQRLEALMVARRKMGWFKPTSWNFYLYLLAREIRYRTGRSHLARLTSLIALASNAHGSDEYYSDEAIRKRIKYFTRSINKK